jgi:hypothetical protein
MTVAIADLGLVCSLAETFAPQFKKVVYTSPGYASPYQRRAPVMIGEGLPGVTRVNDLDDIEDADLYVFPDVTQGKTQLKLAQAGKRVWGARMAEQLELQREGAKQLLSRAGVPIGPYTVVTGTDALIAHLKPLKDKWIKTDTYRGDMESWHYVDWRISEEKLLDVAHTFGPATRNDTRFIIEDAINDSVEVAIDTFSVDGAYPRMAACGIEIKGTAYLAHVMRWQSIPQQLRDIYASVAPMLKAYRCRQMVAFETRIDKAGKAWVVDPCIRFGSPPSESMQAAITNLPQVMAEGSEGRLVEPEYAGRWIAQVVLTTPRAEDHQIAVRYPDSIARFVKLRQYGMVKGIRYCFPGDVKTPTIGSAIGIGDTAQAAIAMCTKHAKMVQADSIEYDDHALTEALEKAKQLEDHHAPIQ